MPPAPPLRVLVVEPDDARYDALAGALAGVEALSVEAERARTREEALAALHAGRADVCLAPSQPGPDLAAGLTLRLARAAAFVPVVAVVDDAADGAEALRDEGAADYLVRDRLSADDLTRALLVARARREAVAAFRREQVVLGTALRQADLALVEVDPEGLVVRASAGVGPVLGVDPREAVGRMVGAVFSGEAEAAVRAVLGGAEGEPVRFRHGGAGGREVEWVASPLPMGGVVVVGPSGAARGEETVAHAVLQHVLDSLPLVVLSADAEGVIRYLGGAALEAFGLTADDLEGESLLDLFARRPHRAAYVRRALSGEPCEAVLDVRGCLFRTRFVPRLDRAGQPDGLVMVAHDVTEHEAAERARRRIAHALDAVADAIGVADVAGTALYVNRALEELLGYSLEAMNAAGGPPALYADPEAAGAVFDAIRAGERWEGEVTLVARSGAHVRLRLAAAAMYDEAGELIGLVGLHRPVEG